jgi:hypothetical protein
VGTGKSHEIKIMVDASNGNIIYDPPKCRAHRGESIVWECEQPFAIQFFGVSPVETVDAQSDIHNQARRSVRMETLPASYPYACAVYADNRVYLDASCPVIIIDYP